MISVHSLNEENGTKSHFQLSGRSQHCYIKKIKKYRTETPSKASGFSNCPVRSSLMAKSNQSFNPAMDWHPIQGGVQILLVASCYRNRS